MEDREASDSIFYLVADEKIVVCSYEAGPVDVFDINTGRRIHTLTHNKHVLFSMFKTSDTDDSDEEDEGDRDAQLSMDHKVVAVVNQSGLVSVWSRSTWTELYSAKHHGTRTPVYGVKGMIAPKFPA